MERLLEGRTAVITGAAQGIGRATAEAFVEHGAAVVLGDLQVEKTMMLARALEQTSGCRALAVQVDVTQRSSVDQMVRAALDSLGCIDILVNVAGTLRMHPVVDFPEEDWDEILAVNLKGTLLCSQAVAKWMISQGRRGVIVNVASCAGRVAGAMNSAYCASKAAVISLTRSLAVELGGYGIRAVGICPGATDTEMLRAIDASVPGTIDQLKAKTVLGKVASARDQANVALFLASDLAAHITGECIIVSGGEVISQ